MSLYRIGSGLIESFSEVLVPFYHTGIKILERDLGRNLLDQLFPIGRVKYREGRRDLMGFSAQTVDHLSGLNLIFRFS